MAATREPSRLTDTALTGPTLLRPPSFTAVGPPFDDRKASAPSDFCTPSSPSERTHDTERQAPRATVIGDRRSVRHRRSPEVVTAASFPAVPALTLATALPTSGASASVPP